MKTIREIADLMVAEAERAERRHGPHSASHHSFGVLMEEVDELWDEVKRDDVDCANHEAIQVGAMAIRFIRESARWNGLEPKPMIKVRKRKAK